MIDIEYHENIISILLEASSRILEIYNSDSLDIEVKADRSPVTQADLVSDKVIIERLHQLTPGLLIISEESEPVKQDDNFAQDRFWLLDPLDGTKEFIARNGEFCISLALIEKGYPIEGYIYAPVPGEFWYAVKDEGAFKWIDGQPVKLPLIRVSGDFTLLKSRSHHGIPEDRWVNNAEKLIKLQFLTHGSAIKFCLIAEGRADLYLKKRAVYGWDIAAGAIILQESGGGILEFDTGRAIKFNPDKSPVSNFLAYGNRIIDPASLLF
ncbi:MAG TPA: 3'(2'),5'-bisphosphate nucleotidase CysQ [Bacteroidales bacterium]|nr:3'(2'),5'-bisphosphate nucleotidase CysQ [Bacteroidales bacterium]